MKTLLQRWAVAITVAVSCAAAARAIDTPPLFQQGMQQVRNGKFSEAIETSHALRNAFPQQPLSALVAVEAYWGMIYCETGHINSSEVWNLADAKSSPYDESFFGAATTALKLSKEMRLRAGSIAAGALYEGIARGARARIYALREQSLQSATEAKQMRSDLMEAVAADPRLSPDANLGLGTYNYYTDALSPILKLFRFIMGIPGGNRKKGLEQLQMAAEQSGLWGVEAKYELARILGVREGKHSEALSLFRDLSARYPDNPLYALSAAYQAEQAGDQGLAFEYAQKAKEGAAKVEAGCRNRLTQAAQGAVERLQAGRSGGKK